MVVNAHTSWWRQFRRRESPVAEVRDSVVDGTRGGVRRPPAACGAACQALPESQRTAIVLRYYEQLEYAEIAELTGVREGSVRARVSRGLAALRQSLGARWEKQMSDLEQRLSDALADGAQGAPLRARPGRGRAVAGPAPAPDPAGRSGGGGGAGGRRTDRGAWPLATPAPNGPRPVPSGERPGRRRAGHPERLPLRELARRHRRGAQLVGLRRRSPTGAPATARRTLPGSAGRVGPR